MRSKRMDRSKTAQDFFAAELHALDKGIRRMHSPSGSYVEERKKLFSVALSYIDELNKVRKYACPLSTNILLSSILESLLLALILQHSNAARKSKIWERAEKEQLRKGQKINEDIPIFYFADLIELADSLRLFRTLGIQDRIDALLIKDLLKSSGIDLSELVKENSWDAKRNHDLMHRLRNFRNAVHPLQIISSETRVDPNDFVKTIWTGLRLLTLLNEMFEIKSPLTQA
jgi:hypothetical protein